MRATLRRLPSLSLAEPARTGVVLLACAVATLLISRHLGPDANWDLRNYHYYNGRAVVTGSFLDDVAPGGFQSYLNPFVDVPIYLFAEAFGSARGLMAWTALVQFACYVALWRLTGAFPKVRDTVWLRIGAFAFAATGSAAMSVAFTTFGDWVVAALICESSTQMMTWSRVHAARRLAASGVFLGLAVSVKYTAGVFLVAIAVATAVAFGLRATGRWMLGAAAGLAVIAGPWMVYLTIRFGSPVFPLYNEVFRADSGPAGNIDDPRYGATSVFGILTFPIDIARTSVSFSELAFADWRWIGVLVLTAAVIGTAGRPRLVRWAGNAIVRWWLCVVVLAYGLWIVMFGYYRYFLFGEIVVSLAIVAMLATLVRGNVMRTVVLAIGMAVLLPLQTVPDWGRGDILDQPALEALVDVDRPARVLFVGLPPFGYLTASFPTSTRFGATFAFSSAELRYAGELEHDLQVLVDEGLADSTLFVVLDRGTTELPEPAAGLRLVDCSAFDSLGRQLELCRLVRP